MTNRMQTSFETGEDVAVVLLNEAGVLLDAHAACAAVFGWSRAELLGKDVKDLLQCGHDLLMQQLVNFQEENDFANGHTSFSIRVLGRRKDQSHFPARVVIRRFPQLECFTAAFYPVTSETEGEAAPTIRPEEIVLAINSNKERTRVLRDRSVTKEKPLEPSTMTNGKSQNGTPPPQPALVKEAPIELKTPIVCEAPPPPAVESAKPVPSAIAPSGSNGVAGAELEKERDARRRAEARVASLSEQLQQLHRQLGENLESESACQAKISELEQRVQNAEQSVERAHAALAEEQAKRQWTEQQLNLLKDLSARSDDAWQALDRSHQQICSRLESSVAAFRESQSRLETELGQRNRLQEDLGTLQREFADHAEKRKTELGSFQSAIKTYLDTGLHANGTNGSAAAA